MKAFNGDAKLKDRCLTSSAWWPGDRDYEIDLGIPEVLVRVATAIERNLAPDRASHWRQDFFYAIRPGADLGGVWPRFVHWLLTDPTDGMVRLATPRLRRKVLKTPELRRIDQKKILLKLAAHYESAAVGGSTNNDAETMSRIASASYRSDSELVRHFRGLAIDSAIHTVYATTEQEFFVRAADAIRRNAETTYASINATISAATCAMTERRQDYVVHVVTHAAYASTHAACAITHASEARAQKLYWTATRVHGEKLLELLRAAPTGR